MSKDKIEKPYDVGYGKTPLHSRWPKGVSGNPAGGKKRARTLNDEVSDVLGEKVAYTLNGEHRTMTKRRALANQAINKGAAGDPKGIKLALDLARNADSEEAQNAILRNVETFTPTVQIFQLPDNGR